MRNRDFATMLDIVAKLRTIEREAGLLFAVVGVVKFCGQLLLPPTVVYKVAKDERYS